MKTSAVLSFLAAASIAAALPVPGSQEANELPLTNSLPTTQITGELLKDLPLTNQNGGLPTDRVTNGLPTQQLTNGLLGKLPLVKKNDLPLPMEDVTELFPTNELTNELLGKLPLVKKGFLPANALKSLPTDELTKKIQLDGLLRGLPLPFGK